MDHFELLGELALRLHTEFRSTFYLLLPIFFALSLVFAWFKEPRGGPDFVESIKRAFIATLLLAAFQEITDSILMVTNGISGKISDMSGLDMIMKMAGDKSKTYTFSYMSALLGANDLIIAALSFLSYLILYVARYIMVALYHFSWIFLSILAPLLLLFHLFTSKITVNLFKTMIEIACWQIVWSVLSAMLTALPFGDAYMADGNYLTVIVINFIIALCMLGTPLVVHSIVGNGFSSVTSSLSPVVFATMAASPTKALQTYGFGREVLSNTLGYGKYQTGRLQSAVSNISQKFQSNDSKQSTPSQASPPQTPMPPPPKK